jgi:hypothetical protein
VQSKDGATGMLVLSPSAMQVPVQVGQRVRVLGAIDGSGAMSRLLLPGTGSTKESVLLCSDDRQGRKLQLLYHGPTEDPCHDIKDKKGQLYGVTPYTQCRIDLGLDD